MQKYLNLLSEVLTHGTLKNPARPGQPKTLELFGVMEQFDLREGFPLLTTKKLSFANIATELLWFLRGDTNIKFLHDNNCHIWDKDAYRFYQELGGSLPMSEWIKYVGASESTQLAAFKNIDKKLTQSVIQSNLSGLKQYRYGDCGKIYGHQWRAFGSGNKQEYSPIGSCFLPVIDQITELIKNLVIAPNSRYHIVSAWNPQDFNIDGNSNMKANNITLEDSIDTVQRDSALPACHMMFQCNVRPAEEVTVNGLVKVEYLDLMFYQRSCDLFLGVPYNWASYALLIHVLCELTGYKPGILKWVGASVHIYETHLDAVKEQLTRHMGTLPKYECKLNPPKIGLNTRWKISFDNITVEELTSGLSDYNPQDKISAPLEAGTARTTKST